MGAYFASALTTMYPDAVEKAGIATVQVISDATLVGAHGGYRMWLTVEAAYLEQVTAYAHRLMDRLTKHDPQTGVVEISDFDAAVASIKEFAENCAAKFWERQEGGKAFGNKQRPIDQARLSRVTDDAVNEIQATKQVFASKLAAGGDDTMTINADEFFAKLEKMGVDEVELASAQRRFNEEKVRLANLWLKRKTDPKRGAAPDNGHAVPTVTAQDFRTQAQHEASRALSRLNDTLRGIEAKRAAEGGLRSGPTVKMYAKAMVTTLEEYLGYLIAEFATFSAAGVPRSELIEVARDCLATTRTSARANSTITKLERMLGGTAPGKHLDDQGTIFDAHASASFARAGLALPTSVGATPQKLAEQYDVFISHASEDKASFVDAFVAALEGRGLKVWYDRLSLEWGGSVRQQIDSGLANSRFGVVVLSPAFVGRYWPQAELDGLLNLEATSGKRVLPIWHNISHADVVKFSPTVSGKLARETAHSTVDQLADEVASLCGKTES